MTKRFSLHPGYVRSFYDAERHYISGQKLIELYGLDPKDCQIVTANSHEIIDPELIPLFPLEDGKYKESLLNRKVNDFYAYRRARKLYVYHTSGSSPRRGTMRKELAEKMARTIAWHERHWPDFRAAYDRSEK